MRCPCLNSESTIARLEFSASAEKSHYPEKLHVFLAATTQVIDATTQNQTPNHSPWAINLALHGKICRLLSGAFFDRCDHQPRDTNDALVILAGE